MSGHIASVHGPLSEWVNADIVGFSVFHVFSLRSSIASRRQTWKQKFPFKLLNSIATRLRKFLGINCLCASRQNERQWFIALLWSTRLFTEESHDGPVAILAYIRTSNKICLLFKELPSKTEVDSTINQKQKERMCMIMDYVLNVVMQFLQSRPFCFSCKMTNLYNNTVFNSFYLYLTCRCLIFIRPMSNLVILFTTLSLNFVSALRFSRYKTTARGKYKVTSSPSAQFCFLFTYTFILSNRRDFSTT